MAYRIEYGPTVPPRYQKKSTATRLRTMTAACLLLFVLLVRQFFPAGTEKLRQFLLPAAPTVTQSAFNDLLSEIRSGASVNDAFTAFCEQIIDHDEILSG